MRTRQALTVALTSGTILAGFGAAPSIVAAIPPGPGRVTITPRPRIANQPCFYASQKYSDGSKVYFNGGCHRCNDFPGPARLGSHTQGGP